MRKRILTVEYEKSIKGVFIVTLNNVRFQHNVEKIITEIIAQFAEKQKLDFVLFRTDGLNLNANQERRLCVEIPHFFAATGSIIRSNDYLFYASSTLDDCTQNNIFLPIFDYYLDTVVFHSNTDLHLFAEKTRNSLPPTCEYLLERSFANVLFHYFDSGDFSIYFRTSKYNSIIVEKQIRSIVKKYS